MYLKATRTLQCQSTGLADTFYLNKGPTYFSRHLHILIQCGNDSVVEQQLFHHVGRSVSGPITSRHFVSPSSGSSNKRPLEQSDFPLKLKQSLREEPFHTYIVLPRNLFSAASLQSSEAEVGGRKTSGTSNYCCPANAKKKKEDICKSSSRRMFD